MKRCAFKTLVLMLLFVVSLSSLILATSAEETGTVYIRNTEFDPAPGQTFTTTLYVAENSNLAGIDLSLSYNTDILTLISFRDIKATCTAGNGNIQINYASESNTVKELKLVELTFLVDENLAAGSFRDWITWTGKDVDEATTYLGVVNGKPQYANLNCCVDLSNLFIRLKGDAYNNSYDGKINSRDAVYILQYAAHMFEMPINDKVYANVFEDYETDENGDMIPKINTRDATKILQYAAKMNVILNDRVNITFYDIDENGEYVVQIVKSVAAGGSLVKIPSVISHEGYENGVWSLEKVSSSAEAVIPDFSNIQSDISVYAVYDHTGKTTEGFILYDQVVEAIDNVFMEEGKYIADDFQLPYKNAKDVYNMPSYADYDVTWKTESGLLAQGLSVVNYIVDIPQLDYTTWVKFTATILIDQVNYGTITFNREIKGTIDLPSSEEFKKIVDDVPEIIEEDYCLPGYVSLESGRMNYGVNIVQNIDIKWTLLSGNKKGYDSFNYAFIHLREANEVALKAEFIFDNRVVASYIISRTIPAKSLEGQKEYALKYLSSFVPSALGNYYLFPTSVERYDFNVSWYSTSASGKFDLSKENVEYNNSMYQQIGVGPKAEYMEIGYLVARIDREGQKVEEFTFALPIVGDSDTVDQTRFGDVKLYDALLSIFGIDDGEGGVKLTEESLTGYLDLNKYVNTSAVSNYRSNNNTIDLSNLGLTSIKGIQYLTTVRVLKLSGNDFPAKDTNGLEYLASLTKLEQLDLSYSKISSLPSNILLNMYNIEGIDLSHNNLTNLDFLKVDRALYSLSDLFVHDNDLIDISGLIYDDGTGNDGATIYRSTIPNVKRLTLNRKNESQYSNEVLDISPLSYANNVAVLWLANHNISDITPLASCKYLETLDLANNDIYALNSNNDGLESITNLTCMRKLVLDNNRITTIRSLRKLVNLEYLSLSDNQISNLDKYLSRVANLVVLNLNNNQLSTFDASYFPQLTFLYLENNQLARISGLATVAPANPTENSEGKTGLIELRLNGNIIDSGTENEAELYLPYISQLTNLRYLSLSGNNVGKLEFLSELKKLEHLELADANVCQSYQVKDYEDPNTGETVMKEVDNLSNLYNLTSLTVLDLSGNEELTDISALANAGGGLVKLECLYLDKRLGVKEVENGETIYYEYNPITNLSSLNDMPRLTVLSLQNSGVTDIGFVRQLGSIEYLNLSGHSARIIDFSILRGKESISYLFLDSVVSSEIKNAEIIGDISDIIALSLENTKFSDIGLLPDWHNIKYLNLAHTSITDFAGADEDFTSINRFKSTLEVLDLSGNDSVFTKHNLNHLYDSFAKLTSTVYLYEDHSKEGFDSAREALTIKKFLEDIPKTAEDNRRQIHTFFKESEFVDGPFALQNVVNDYSLTWSINDEWFDVTDNVLSVNNWDLREDHTLTLHAAFDVYDNDDKADSISMLVFVEPSPYTIRKYSQTATMENFDDSVYSEETGFFNVGIDVSSEVELDNYSFDGWFTGMFGSEVNMSEDYINNRITPEGNVSDVVAYAKWLYDVKYNANGGQLHNAENDNPHTYISNEGVILPDVEHQPTRTNYCFDYWFVSDENIEFVNGTVTHNVQLNAKWYYLLQYDANGGTLNDVEWQRFDEFEEVILPKEPTRDGFVFEGWYSVDKDCIVKNNDILYNMTLVAEWTPIPYSAQWNSDVGYSICVERTSSPYAEAPLGVLENNSVVYYGDVLSITYSSNVGYTITSIGEETIVVSGDVTSSMIYAVASEKTYYIEYDANGGTGITPTSVHSYNHGKSLTANGFLLDGWVFTGWNTEADGSGLSYKDEEIVLNLTDVDNGTVTLYAQWTPVYKVEWEGGIGYTIKVERVSSPYVGVNTGVLNIGDAVYYGDCLKVTYTAMVGYSLVDHGEESLIVTGNVNSDLIYALVHQYGYTISYDANGGIGVTTDSLHIYEEYGALSDNGFTRHGWTFLGWSTNPSATSVIYTNCQSVKDVSPVIDGKVILYAVWEPILSFTIDKSELNIFIPKDKNYDFKILFDDYVDLSSLKEMGYTKVTITQDFDATKTTNDGGYIISQVIKGGNDIGFSDLIDNTNYDAGEKNTYTNAYYIGDNTKGQTYHMNWVNSFELANYSGVYINHFTKNIYTDLFGGYKAPHKMTNYTVTVVFSK